MKSLAVLLSVLAVGLCTDNCKIYKENSDPSTDFIDIKEKCVDLATEQIRMEFRAALAYLQLGAYFNQFDVNRPGFAEFFFAAASEERSHAIKIFDYLLMRGQLTEAISPDGKKKFYPELHTLLRIENNNKTVLGELSTKLSTVGISALDALNEALKLEVSVTQSIKRMIKACEKDDNLSDPEKVLVKNQGDERISQNDYHMVDWLITDLLDEQLNGQRELAGRISTLYKMKDGYGTIAEFLYDKKLLEELHTKAA